MISANQSAMSEMLYKCHPCGKVFKSTEKMEEHKGCKKHKKNEKEYQLKNPASNSESMFQSISQNQEQSFSQGGAQISESGEALTVEENTE